MIRHVVMWKLKDDASKEANAKKMKDMLLGLKGKIGELRRIEVGINENPKESYDIVLITEFDDMESLEAYARHPEHLKVADYVSKVRESRACVDYKT